MSKVGQKIIEIPTGVTIEFLLKDAGVDMASSEPFEAAVREMNAVMDEIEALLSAAPGR